MADGSVDPAEARRILARMDPRGRRFYVKHGLTKVVRTMAYGLWWEWRRRRRHLT